MSDVIFFGSKSDNQTFFEKKGVKEVSDTPEKQTKLPEENLNRFKIDLNTLEPMKASDLKDLEETWLRHDPYTIWMQPNLEFYDYFYLHEDEDDELTKAARQIRRTYRNYPDYQYACDVRDMFIERIFEEKFEGNEFKFQAAIRSGTVGWIPPRPNYSRTSSDYARYQAGVVNLIEPNEMSDDEYIAFLKKFLETESENIPDDINVSVDVLDDLKIIEKIDNENKDDGYSAARSIRSMDLRNFQEIVKDWYKPTSSKVTDKDNIDEVFSKTPEKIREKYYESFKVDLSGLKARLDEYGTVDEEENMQELVLDEETGRPMTRAEMKKREIVRYMKEYGWDELPLMRNLGVGNAAERRRMMLDEKKTRKNKLKADAIMDMELDSIYGQSPAYDVNDYDAYSTDSILDQVFGTGGLFK